MYMARVHDRQAIVGSEVTEKTLAGAPSAAVSVLYTLKPLNVNMHF